MSNNKIAVINSMSFGKYFPEHIKRLEKVGSVDFLLDISPDIDGYELAKKLHAYEYIIPSVTPNFDRIFFENSPNLKLIARHGLGFNNIDIDAATEHGVYVTKIIGEYERDTVAELSVAFISSAIRHVVPANDALKSGNWLRKADFFGKELHALTVGIIGLGNIGSRVAEILTKGYGTKVIAYDPLIDFETAAKYGAEKVELDYLLKNSDVISLNASVTNTSYKMLKEREFTLMKDEVIIVNTARGELLEEETLIKHLDSGKVKTYATDVFETEPLPKESRLKDYEYNILTPHIGAYTDFSLKAMGDKVVKDVELVAQGKKPLEIVNQEVLNI